MSAERPGRDPDRPGGPARDGSGPADPSGTGRDIRPPGAVDTASDRSIDGSTDRGAIAEAPAVPVVPASLASALAGWLLVLTMAMVVADRWIGGWPGIVADATVAVAVAILVPAVPWGRRIFVALAGALILAALALAPDPTGVIDAGLASGAFIAAFFTAQACLRSVAARSPAIADCGSYIAHQPPGRRYLALTAGGQLFGIVLGYGALSLLGTLAETAAREEANETRRRIRRRRMLLAIQRGFVSTLPWSPLAFAVAITTALLPGISWSAMVLPCLVSGVVLAGTGWALDSLLKPRVPGPPAVFEPDARSWRQALAPLVVLLALMGGAVAGVATLGAVSAPIAVMIVVPPLALAWIAVQTGGDPAAGGAPPRHAAGPLAGPLAAAAPVAAAVAAAAPPVATGPPPPPAAAAPAGPASWSDRRGAMAGWAITYVTRELPAYRGELVLLVMAGVIGTIGGRLAAPAIAAGGLDLAVLPAWQVLMILLWAVPVAGQAGMNPILAVSLLAPLLPSAESFGTTPVAVAVAITAGWSISGVTSPFTATTLIIGSFGRVSATHVGLRWNALYTAITGVLLSAWTLAVHAMGI
ncbi:MAG: hypothetical protein AAFV86_10650 [Pseudomonadota bacterium]